MLIGAFPRGVSYIYIKMANVGVMDQNDEFEMLTITPIRRLERELRQMKEQIRGGDSHLAIQIVEILRLNQTLVDQLATKQSELIAKVSETDSTLQKLVVSLDNLIGLMSAGAESEMEDEAREGKNAGERLDKIIEQNAILINSLNMLAKEMGKLGPPAEPSETTTGDQ